MRKLFIFFIAFFCFVNLNAQLFVGGSFSLYYTGGKEKTNNNTSDKPSTTSFNLSPMLGYYMDSKMAVGANINLGFSRTNNNADPKVISSSSTIGLSPFIRYHLIEMGQLSLLGQGYLSFSYTKEKVKSGNTTNDGDKTTSIGLGVLPGVSYKLTDKISIEAFIGGLSFNTSTVKKPNDDKETDNSLSLSLSSNLNIGFIYKF